MNESFLDHLEALRQTVLRCVAAWAVALPVSLWLAPYLVDLLLKWSAPEKITEWNYFSPLEVFLVNLRVSAILSLVLSFPYCARKIWDFVLPALTPNERRGFGFWICLASGLFLAGATFCVAVVLPMVMRFAASFATERIHPVLGVSQFVSMAGSLAFAFGVAFQLPVAVCIAVRFGLVKTAMLRKGRPYSLVAILIVAAILTPPDVISQILLACPMLLLYEAGLWLAARSEKKLHLPVENDGASTPHDDPLPGDSSSTP